MRSPVDSADGKEEKECADAHCPDSSLWTRGRVSDDLVSVAYTIPTPVDIQTPCTSHTHVMQTLRLAPLGAAAPVASRPSRSPQRWPRDLVSTRNVHRASWRPAWSTQTLFCELEDRLSSLLVH